MTYIKDLLNRLRAHCARWSGVLYGGTELILKKIGLKIKRRRSKQQHPHHSTRVDRGRMMMYGGCGNEQWTSRTAHTGDDAPFCDGGGDI
jgi:hypothetical protein